MSDLTRDDLHDVRDQLVGVLNGIAARLELMSGRVGHLEVAVASFGARMESLGARVDTLERAVFDGPQRRKSDAPTPSLLDGDRPVIRRDFWIVVGTISMAGGVISLAWRLVSWLMGRIGSP